MNKKVVLLLIFVLLNVYIYLFSYFLKSLNEKPKNNLINHASIDIKITDIENFIDSNHLDYLDSINGYFNNSKDLSNDIKLKYSYLSLSNELDFAKGVSSKVIKNYINKIFGNNGEFINNDFKINNINVIYNKNNDIYLTNSVYSKDYIIYKYKKKYKSNKDKASITYYKLFIKNYKVYSTFGDMTNDINVLYELDKEDNLEKFLDNKINEESSKFSTYTYSFLKENGNLFLNRYKKG